VSRAATKRAGAGEGGGEEASRRMTRAELAAVPPQEFVAARNALVKELREGGQDDEATRCEAAPPDARAVGGEPPRRRGAEGDGRTCSPPARSWARRSGRCCARGDREAMRDAEAELKGAVLALVESGEALLGKGGAGLDRRIGDTLRAAATGDEATRKELAAGRLERELEPSTGFDPGGAPLPKRHPPKKPKPSAAEAREARRQAAAAVREERRKAKLRAKLDKLRAQLADTEAALH
jgi:hypothetical protein